MVPSLTRLTHAMQARDPGRARLVSATAISLGVLASVLSAWLVLHATHTSLGLLSIALFVSLQAGNLAHDATPTQRLVSTAWFVPVVPAAMLVAHMVSSVQPLAIVCFVLLAGSAVWLRNLGQRAASIGSLAFISFFFTLFLRPSDAEMPVMMLMGLCAVVPQVCVRAVLLAVRPRRELTVLLAELRRASWVVLDLALRPQSHAERTASHERQLQRGFERLDAIVRGVTAWQARYDTTAHLGCTASALSDAVLEARVETEIAADRLRAAPRFDHTDVPAVVPAAGHQSVLQAAHQRIQRLRPGRQARQNRQAQQAQRERKARTEAAQRTLQRYLSSHHADPARVRAVAWAHAELRTAAPDSAGALAARVIVAHEAVRQLSASGHGAHRVGAAGQPNGAPRNTTARAVAQPGRHSAPAAAPASAHRSPLRSVLRWRQWSTPTRMAVQAMIAAAVASGVGELIDVSRWYWAVMTAFVIFTGASTRGSVLTRASRRLVGTLGGVLLGSAAVLLVGSDERMLVAIALIAVFGMLYLGPLNYLYTTTCMTTMLVAMYRMLGVLNTQLLELRLVETLAGALIGVLCAYFILSANSRPAIRSSMAEYGAAFTGLLQAAAGQLSVPPAPAEAAELALQRLDAARAAAAKMLADNETATMLAHPRTASPLSPALGVLSRAAAQVLRASEQLRQGSVDAAALAAGLARVTANAQLVLSGNSGGEGSAGVATPASLTSETPDASAAAEVGWAELPDPPTRTHVTPETQIAFDDAWQALEHLQWGLRRVAHTPQVLTRPPRASGSAPEPARSRSR